MIYIYNAGIRLYSLAIQLAAPFNTKARKFVKGRKKIFARIKESVKDNNAPNIWFHCASLGEFEQGRPLIEATRKQFTDHRIIITFFSPSGYEVRKNYPHADMVFYLPIDTPKNAQKLVNLLNPEIAFFIKYEFWFNYLRALHANNIPIISVSAKFRVGQLFFKKHGTFFKTILTYFNHIFVQDTESRDLLNTNGINNVTISGDTRFDRVYQIANNAQPISEIEHFKNNHLLIVAGSTWPEDEKVIIPYIKKSAENKKFIIAPHEVHSTNISRIENMLEGLTAIKYSEMSHFNNKTIQESNVLIVDNVGMLSSIYKYSEIAYVGGAFRTGLHNILEPATFGIPVIFGPYYEKFKEAQELVRQNGAISIQNYHQLAEIMDNLSTNDRTRTATGEICKNYIQSNRGATSAIMNYVISRYQSE